MRNDLAVLTNWRADVRDAWRALLRSPRHVATVVLCLGLGLTVTVGVFSVLTSFIYGDRPGIRNRASLVRLFIVHDAGSAVGIGEREPGRVTADPSLSDFESLARDPGPGLESLGAEGPLRVALRLRSGQAAAGDAITAVAVFSSPDYFRTPGTTAHRGRLLAPSDDRPDAPPVIVIGYHLWRDRLGADEAIVGKELVVGGRTFAVIGIAPPRFTGIKATDTTSSPLDGSR